MCPCRIPKLAQNQTLRYDAKCAIWSSFAFILVVTIARLTRPGGIRSVLLRSQGRKSDSVEFHADHPNQSFQGTSVSGRGDHALRPLVPAISARLRERCRVVGGTRRGGGPQLHLAVGAGLCPRTEQALPPPSETDKEKLPHGRDVYKG